MSQIKSKVKKLAEVIDAPADTLPTFGRSEQSGRPHIEVDPRGYHYVIAEAGRSWSAIPLLTLTNFSITYTSGSPSSSP